MNTNEFLQEVLHSDICPENFEDTYTEFLRHQNAAIDTLKEVHRICEKYGLHYQMAFGSLLGAIRDNGQIPWDYDIDIFLPYNEKQKLIEALNEDLNSDFYYYCPEVNRKCRHFMMRVAPKEYRSEGLHVDVFYLVGAPSDEEQLVTLGERISRLINLRYIKLVNTKVASKGHFRKRLWLVREKLKHLKYSLRKIDEEFEELATKYPLETAEKCICADSGGYGVVAYDKEKLFDTELKDVEFGTVRITKYYDELLKKIYKDYTRPLPLQTRIKEVLTALKSINYYNGLK